jgi:RNA polymerase sigma-70 factor (ECF subfamily)
VTTVRDDHEPDEPRAEVSVPGDAGASAVDPRVRYEALFAEVYEPLQRYVRRRCGSADADDVVAEVLTVVWRRLDQVPADAPVAWTFGVARRVLANQHRSTGRRLRLIDRVRRMQEPIPAHEVDDTDLAEALDRLTSEDREILHLWAWEQLAPREIAVVLDITANAASLRLHRARGRLAEAMGRQDLVPAGQMQGGSTPHPSTSGDEVT